MARPTKLTPEVQQTIVEAIKVGNYKETAAALAGIHRDTLNGWELRGATGEEPYASFSDAVKKAEAEAETELVQSARTGSEGWQAKAWVLERRWPKRWSGRVRMAVTEELGAYLDRLQRNLDEPTFRKVVDAGREDGLGAGGGEATH